MSAPPVPIADKPPVPPQKDPSPPPPAPTPIQPIDAAAYVDDAPAFSEAVQKILAQEPDPELVEVRKASATSERELTFVPWIHYQRVLFQAFGVGGYRLVPRGPVRTEGNVVTWHGALFVRAPGSTKFQFVKEAKGECGLQGGMTPGNAAEGAQSDCLVKCCKGLGIFDCLFDPRWRRAWESKYRRQHDANKKAAAWPEGRPANGVAAPAPAPTASAPAASPTSEAAGADGSAVGVATEPASSTQAGDTGEPATDEQREAIRGLLRAAKFTRGYVRQWFHGTFGSPLNIDDPVGWLSQRQADAAYVLLSVHGKGALYDALLKRYQETGSVEGSV